MLAPAPYDELDEASKRMLESEDVGEEDGEAQLLAAAVAEAVEVSVPTAALRVCVGLPYRGEVLPPRDAEARAVPSEMRETVSVRLTRLLAERVLES